MSTLCVSHNIYLTRDERYRLADGENIEVSGVSVPVWFARDGHTAITSEPGNEVFCLYQLTRDQEDIPVGIEKKGYRINLPMFNNGEVVEMTNPTNLKDLPDGSGYIRFRESNKFKKGQKMVNIIHFVEIKTVEELQATLI